MTYLNDIGFVVKRVNLGEADRFVTIFTKNSGKVEVLAKGVRKISSRRSSHIELLNQIRFNSVKTRKNFILTEIDLVNSFEEKRKTLEDCQIIFLVCELIDNLCPLGQINLELFSMIEDFVTDGDFSSEAMLSFETKILLSLGYWNVDKEFKSEKEASNFIESIIERKIKSRVIGSFNFLQENA